MTLDYLRVREADNVQLELLSPYVLQSDSPGLTVSRCRGNASGRTRSSGSVSSGYGR